MDDDLKANLTRGETWRRALLIVLFAIFYGIAEFVMIAVVVFQFLHLLVTGERNARVLRFGDELATWFYQVLRFATFNSDQAPWPLTDWPTRATPALRRDTET